MSVTSLQNSGNFKILSGRYYISVQGNTTLTPANMTTTGYWWSSNAYNASSRYVLRVISNYTLSSGGAEKPEHMYNVRCILDN